MQSLQDYDIMSSNILNEGEEEMLSRYHTNKSIYLYCVTDSVTANNMINGVIKYPITLYEYPIIARNAVKGSNIQNEVMLRIAVKVNSYNEDGGLFYDELLMNMNEIVSKAKLSKEDYIKKCGYTRTIKAIDSKKVIVYEIKYKSRILSVQNID